MKITTQEKAQIAILRTTTEKRAFHNGFNTQATQHCILLNSFSIR